MFDQDTATSTAVTAGRFYLDHGVILECILASQQQVQDRMSNLISNNIGTENCLAHAIELFDAANAADQNMSVEDGKQTPKELLYARRMSAMLQRFAPDADAAVRLAVRAQHIERWKSPRSSYPMNRAGYHEWRTALYDFHAERASALMREAGCDEDLIARVAVMLRKESLADPATQMMEDVVALVFIEYYMADFAAQHPEYDEAKWLGIIAKTWRKMSPRGHAFALSGIKLPEALVPLIKKAVGL
jgi:hypothetical protein